MKKIMKREKSANFPNFQNFKKFRRTQFEREGRERKETKRVGDSNCSGLIEQPSVAKHSQHVCQLAGGQVPVHALRGPFSALDNNTDFHVFPKPFPTAQGWLHSCTSKAQSARQDNCCAAVQPSHAVAKS